MTLYNNISQNNLDDLFQKSEIEKELPISDGAWNRVSELLAEDTKQKRIFRIRVMSIAASLVFLLAVLVHFNAPSSPYHLEALDITENDGIYSTQDVAFLNQTYLASGMSLSDNNVQGAIRVYERE